MTDRKPKAVTDEDRAKAEAAKDAADHEAKAEAERKAAEAKRKADVLTDYQKHLDDVMAVKAMTDTAVWQRFYASIRSDIAIHQAEVLDAEKTRQIIQHQEGVKVLRRLLERPRAAVDALNDFCHAMPLWAGEMKTRAEWNEALGRVEIRTL